MVEASLADLGAANRSGTQRSNRSVNQGLFAAATNATLDYGGCACRKRGDSAASRSARRAWHRVFNLRKDGMGAFPLAQYETAAKTGANKPRSSASRAALVAIE